MENNKKWTGILAVLLFLQVVAQVVATVILLKLDMLPGNLVVAMLVAMALLMLATALLIFVKVNGKIALWRRIVAILFAVLVICGSVVAAYMASTVKKTVENVSGADITANSRNVYVLVLSDDPAQTLADTAGYRFGVIENYDIEHTQQAIHAVEAANGETVTPNYYPSASAMGAALYSKEVNALIVSGVSISFLIEEENYGDFMERVRVLHTQPFTEEETPEQTIPEAQVEDVITKPFVVYISGSDTRSDKLAVSLSDVNILATVNPQTKQILLLNTPRDYFVPNPAGNGALDKLTHCGKYGVNYSIQALENLYGIKVDYYGRINFTGFEAFIDAIGGINFYSDVAFTARDTSIKAGDNYLTGAQALDVSRERYHVKGGDNGRGKNQMKLIEAVVKKVSTSSTIISNYGQILNSLVGMFETSFQAEEISALVKMQLSDMATWDIQSYAVVGKGGSEITYSYPGQQLSVMWPDEKAVAHGSALVQKVRNGEILTQDDMTLPK